MQYWVFIEDSNPVGVVSVGKEPIQLIAPSGTPVAIIGLIDPDQPKEVIREFATEALVLSREKVVEYALAIFPRIYEEPIKQFKELNFQELDDAYMMTCPLDRSFEPSNVLRFKRAQRSDMRRFLELAIGFLSGSPDVMLGMALKNLFDVPEEFLDLLYTREEFYFAERDGQIIGVINLNPNEELISNIGVDPRQRGKSFGRQIMLFGLKALKDRGCKLARLRVHVENKPAIHLYKKLGFTKTDQYLTLIWRKEAHKNLG